MQKRPAEFNNHYNADGELTLTATKNLSGRAITDGEFEFTLSRDGEVIDTAANVGTNVTFKKLTYQTEDIGKTYTYIMQEIDKGVKWYTCDKTRYQVTVTITDKNDGTLNVAKTIEKLGEDGEENEQVLNAVFNNEYKAEAQIGISAEKILKGRAIADRQFSFTLKGTAENEANGDTNKDQTVKNVGNTVTFADLKYTEKNAGKTYTYLLQEAIPESKANGYTYDDTVYTVIVEVTDAGEGKLNVQKTIVKADESGELAPVDKAVSLTPTVQRAALL